jgi:hypothetical protein
MKQDQLQAIAQKLYNKKFPDSVETLKFLSDVKAEAKPRFTFLYFETEVVFNSIKRYNMVATDPLMIEVIWYETNVVLLHRGYTDGLYHTIKNFRRDLLYWLLNLEHPSKSVCEDTIDNI